MCPLRVSHTFEHEGSQESEPTPSLRVNLHGRVVCGSSPSQRDRKFPVRGNVTAGVEGLVGPLNREGSSVEACSSGVGVHDAPDQTHTRLVSMALCA